MAYEEETDTRWKNCVRWSVMICATREMLLDRSNEMGGACSYGEKKNAYRILVRKPEGKKPLGRLKP